MTQQQVVNWTNDDIMAARGQRVRLRDGRVLRVALIESGLSWSVGPYQRLDIWGARAVLNNNEAVLVTEEAAQ